MKCDLESIPPSILNDEIGVKRLVRGFNSSKAFGGHCAIETTDEQAAVLNSPSHTNHISSP